MSTISDNWPILILLTPWVVMFAALWLGEYFGWD